ncbi:hypothetical protein [uncultured Tateyamaria sp.]|uniref:hypothetical protein n=1 Tax=uncultured Tateyamaria sp. TaxID=455651 RepID=UPI002630EB5A|nr:hypothetical protein [uncultured Tateyamaria sp.]
MDLGKDGTKLTSDQLQARADQAALFERANVEAVGTVMAATQQDIDAYAQANFSSPVLPQKVGLKQLTNLKTFAGATVADTSLSQSADMRNRLSTALQAHQAGASDKPEPTFDTATKKLTFASPQDQAKAIVSALDGLAVSQENLKSTTQNLKNFGAKLNHGSSLTWLGAQAQKNVMGNQFHAVVARSAITAIAAASVGLLAGRLGATMVTALYENNRDMIPNAVLEAAREDLISEGNARPTQNQIEGAAIAALGKPGSQFVSNEASKSEIETTDGVVNYLRGIIFPAGDQLNLASAEKSRAESALSTEAKEPPTRAERAWATVTARGKTQLVMGGISAGIAAIAQFAGAVQNEQSASDFVSSLALNAFTTMGPFVVATLTADAITEVATEPSTSQLHKELLRTPVRAAMQTIAQTFKTGVTFAQDSSKTTWAAESLKLIGTGFIGTLGKEGTSSVLSVVSKAGAPADVKATAALVDTQSALSKLQLLLDTNVAENFPDIADDIRNLEEHLGGLNTALTAITTLHPETDRDHLSVLNSRFTASIETAAQNLGYITRPTELSEVVIHSAHSSAASTQAEEWGEDFVTALFQEILDGDGASSDSGSARSEASEDLGNRLFNEIMDDTGQDIPEDVVVHSAHSSDAVIQTEGWGHDFAKELLQEILDRATASSGAEVARSEASEDFGNRFFNELLDNTDESLISQEAVDHVWNEDVATRVFQSIMDNEEQEIPDEDIANELFQYILDGADENTLEEYYQGYVDDVVSRVIDQLNQ